MPTSPSLLTSQVTGLQRTVDERIDNDDDVDGLWLSLLRKFLIDLKRWMSIS